MVAATSTTRPTANHLDAGEFSTPGGESVESAGGPRMSCSICLSECTCLRKIILRSIILLDLKD